MSPVFLDIHETYSEFAITIQINGIVFDTQDYRVCDICITIAKLFGYSLTMSSDKFVSDTCQMNCYEEPLLTLDSQVFLRKYLYSDFDLSVHDPIVMQIMDLLINEEIVPKPDSIIDSSK